jgi:alcohol dehydrogenase (NADP+)
MKGKSMHKAKAYSAASATSALASTKIPRRDPTENDVQIEILYCGICHSDLHSVRNEWSEFMPTVYPIVPGHEIVGRVTKVAQPSLNSRPATWQRLAAWSTRMERVPSAELGLSSSART